MSLIDRLTYRGRVNRPAQTAVSPTLRNSIQIYRVIQDRVDIYEVDSVGNVETLAVGVIAVWCQGA
jgi:hypothetical protein